MNTKTTIDKGKYVSPECTCTLITIEHCIMSNFGVTTQQYDLEDDDANWE